MLKTTATLFAMLCTATALLSNSMMGDGIWFWIIITSGMFVGMSPYFPVCVDLGALVAGLLSVISIGAVLLGLVAATIGGSFNLGSSEGLLLFLFFLIAFAGLSHILATKRQHRIVKT